MSAPSAEVLYLLEYLAVFCSSALCLLLKMEEYMINPYMDEIFHIPQAQKYCDGNFSDVCFM